jgi:hypothetical protein
MAFAVLRLITNLNLVAVLRHAEESGGELSRSVHGNGMDLQAEGPSRRQLLVMQDRGCLMAQNTYHKRSEEVRARYSAARARISPTSGRRLSPAPRAGSGNAARTRSTTRIASRAA